PRRPSTLFPYTTLFRSLSVRVQAGGAEEAHGRADLGQRAEALDELGLDAHHPPRILVRPGGPRTAVEQTLIRRRLRHLVTAVRRSEEHTSELQSRFDLV